MDHNDVRKGILQANMIERNSGLLSAEMTIVPFVAAIFAANAAENSLLCFLLSAFQVLYFSFGVPNTGHHVFGWRYFSAEFGRM